MTINQQAGALRAAFLEFMARDLPPMVLPMKAVRTAMEHQRLGSGITQTISEELLSRGKRHLPARLPNDQNSTVLIWTFGQPGTEILELALRQEENTGADSILTRADLQLLLGIARDACLDAQPAV